MSNIGYNFPASVLPSVNNRAVTGPDSNAANVVQWNCAGGDVIRLGAISSAASATLSGRVIFFANGAPISSAQFTFTAQSSADYGSLYLGVPTSDAWYPTAGAAAYAVKVDSVSAGNWTLSGSAL